LTVPALLYFTCARKPEICEMSILKVFLSA